MKKIIITIVCLFFFSTITLADEYQLIVILPTFEDELGKFMVALKTEYQDYVFSTFLDNYLDMEPPANEDITYCNNVPFLMFRSLSNLSGEDPEVNQIGIFIQFSF